MGIPENSVKGVGIVLTFFSFFNHRESYMSAHVLLNLLNSTRKRYKMQGKRVEEKR